VAADAPDVVADEVGIEEAAEPEVVTVVG